MTAPQAVSVEGAGPGPGFVAAETLGSLNRRLAADLAGWGRVDRCPACLEGRPAAFATIRSIPYERCRACGFVFANPRPPDGVVAEFYNSDFYNNYRVLEAGRRAAQPYYSISAYTDQRELARWLLATKPESVLDFGCGPGAFLALLRDEFGIADVDGLELNQASVAVARDSYGLDIRSDRASLRHPSYDAVVMLEVIEHVSDLDAVMADVADLVRPDGHLLLTTPAVDNVIARRLPQVCPHFTGPSHVSMFTVDAMAAMLGRHGFVIEELRTDPTPGVATAAARSLLYALDIRSPRDAEDTEDLWWVPTRLGRLLRRPEGRAAPLPRSLRALCRLLDRVLGRAAARSGRAQPDHLYVLARRSGPAS